jgi:predicted RNase H-like nuclease
MDGAVRGVVGGGGVPGAGPGRAGLKAVEDLADAHVCAYVGLWWWSHGRAATLVAGDDASGAILVPRPGR